MKLRDIMSESFNLNDFSKKIAAISPTAKIGKLKNGGINVTQKGIGIFTFYPESNYIRVMFNGSQGRDWSKAVGDLNNQILEFKRLYEKYI